MITWFLELDGGGRITHYRWLLTHPWLAAGLMALACAYVVLLYRRERSLTRGRRIVLVTCRAAAVAIVVLLIFRPALAVEMKTRLPRTLLVLLDTSESMARRDQRTRTEDIKEAALALGKVSYAQTPETLGDGVRADSAAVSRMELAKAVLGNAELKLLERLGKEYELRFFRFGESLQPAGGKGELGRGWLAEAKADQPVTRLGRAVEEAASRYAGQAVAGMIVLTDGASNAGRDPVDVGREMRQRNVPVFPVGLGLSSPPDVRVAKVFVQEAVFHKDEAPVRAQIVSRGFAGRTVNVSVLLDGVKVAGKVAVLEEGGQFEELLFTPMRTGGQAKLEVKVQPVVGEAELTNNAAARTIRIIDEKIKVLYVEGMPRWEYRYLRRILQRDERLDVKFLLTQGDRDLAEFTDDHLADFPAEAGEAFAFDLVILGDVPASFFAHSQLVRIEQLVKERGGSLLMIAGEEHAPGSYARTPLGSVLPVRLSEQRWRDVDESVHPRITDDGERSTITSLDAPAERNQQLWSRVRPLYKVPLLDGAKPAAVVLAELSMLGRGGEGYPLIAWQRYGSGKAMFVGTDQLWRLRFKVGDKYHGRFWGQAIPFLTLSRLLGENKRVRLETGGKEFRQHERVEITANVLNESFDPIEREFYTVRLQRPDEAADAERVRLEPVPDIAGLYQGHFVPRHRGRYVIQAEPADEDGANEAGFVVEASTLEQLEPAMQQALLAKLAEASGGRYFSLADLPDLPAAIQSEHRTTLVRRDRDLWDLPAIFVVLLALLGAEWLLRRRYDLI